MVKKSGGFTLVEMMVGLVIVCMGGLLMATVVKNTTTAKTRSEGLANANMESNGAFSLLMRTSKNLHIDRMNQRSTFYQNAAGNYVALNPAAAAPSVATYRINVSNWLSNPRGNPLASQVQSRLSGIYDVYLDGSVLEEHEVAVVGGVVNKRTRRLLVSRCDSLSNYRDLSVVQGDPRVTALYVLGVMNRRPFIRTGAGGRTVVQCCPPTNPNCTGQSFGQNYFRIYAIHFRNNQVSSVEEFPRADVHNSSVGLGFMMKLPGPTAMTVETQFFRAQNRCRTSSTFNHPACNNTRTLEAVGQAYRQNNSVINLGLQVISLPISNNIVSTGVIAL